MHRIDGRDAAAKPQEGSARPPQRTAVDGPWRWNSRIACRTLDGNAFILLDGRMIRLDEVASFIWERFQDGATLAEVVEHVIEQFDTTAAVAAEDAGELVSQLIDRQMLVPA